MPKKQTTPIKSKKTWFKYGLLTVLAFVVMGFVIYSGYQSQVDKAEADKFAALQSDFKKLQLEFNKIDPGWEYSESCTASGLLDDLKTCSVGISINSINGIDIKKTADLYEALIEKSEYLRKSKQAFFTHETKDYIETTLVYAKMKNANCDLLVQKEKLNSMLSASVGCSSHARMFHFDRLDR